MIATDIKAETKRVDAALHPPPTFSSRRFVRTLACTLLVPVVVYILTFVAALSPKLGLRALGVSKFGPILDYGYEAKHVDADVLIFGDSSAFLGVDPRVVNSALNVRTAVLPNTIGSLPMTGDLVLRRYLEHNRRPRTLVLYFAPWNLNYDGTQKKEFLLEGEEEIMRYGSWQDIGHAVSKYTAQFIVFPFQALEPLGIRNLLNALRHTGAERASETAKAFGHWDYNLSPAVLQNNCRVRPEFTKGLPHDTVRMLKERYQAQGMQVVVYLAPIPACSNAKPTLLESYADVNAAAPVLLPPGWFADDSFAAHIRAEHVRDNSLLFADRLGKVLGQPLEHH